MKIAIVSTGLGHIARGIEAWAIGMARGLGEKAEGGDLRPEDRCQQSAHSAGSGQAVSSQQAARDSERAGEDRDQHLTAEAPIDVTLFGSSCLASRDILSGLRSHPSSLTLVSIPSLKRGDTLVRAWVKLAPEFTWRWGWKSGYAIEQKSFAKHLIPRLQRGNYDVVHTQDLILALELEKARKRGVITTPTILAHGTDESMELLAQLEYVQHLSPEHERRELNSKQWTVDREKKKRWVIPNFVDTFRFTPSTSNVATNNYRAKLGIPNDALVIGCSAALQFSHKRLDYLIREMSSLNHIHLRSSAVPFLLLAGAETDETSQVEVLAQELLGDKCRILKNLPFDQMPDYYRALDIYVHPASEEFFGICFLEAMACGVPVVAHDSETLRWIVGVSTSATNNKQLTTLPKHSGGACLDMNEEGAVAGFLREVTPEWIEEHGRQARVRVEKMFSWEAVEPKFIEMYREVMIEEQSAKR